VTQSEIISGFNLSVDQGIAQALGIEAAFIFNHIIYWLRINADKRDVEKIEGKYWMYETQKEMAEFFGFLDEDKVCRGIKKLIESGLLIKKCLSKNPFDRTYSYTVTDQGLIKKSLRNPPICGMQTPQFAESDTPQFAECIYTTEDQEKTNITAAAKLPAAALSKDKNKTQTKQLLEKTEQKKKKPAHFPIYECLKDLDLKHHEKIQLTRLNAEERMIEAVKLSKSKKIPPDNLAGFLHWAATNGIKCPSPREDTDRENKELAELVKKKFSHPNIFIEVLSKNVEFVFCAAQKDPIVINYSERGFKDKLDNCIKTLCFKEVK
jgi:hypothetical protein